jgi:hypothetical protein
MTQVEMVLKHMQDTGSITTWQAIKEYGCTRLSGKIYLLKKKGYKIGKETISFTNRYGTKGTYAEYRLEE